MTAFCNKNQSPYRVGFLLIDKFSLLTYSAATEPLRAANQLSGQPMYEIWNIPAQGARAVAACGTLVPANAHVGERLGFDLVFVVAASDSSDARQPRLLDWLRQLARRGIVLGGLGAGPLMLARAGLLRDRRATLHWAFKETLAETHPDVNIEQQLFVIDNDRITCAGGTAPVDLAHAIIAEQHGSRFATRVSDWWSHAQVQASNAPQRSGRESRFGTHNATVIEAIALMEDHLSDPLDLGQLAATVKVSERQIDRMFKQHLGVKPMDCYKRLRLQKSFELLTQSTMKVGDVVAATGFVSSSHFSRSFRQMFDVSPSEARTSGSASLGVMFSSDNV